MFTFADFSPRIRTVPEEGVDDKRSESSSRERDAKLNGESETRVDDDTHELLVKVGVDVQVEVDYKRRIEYSRSARGM